MEDQKNKRYGAGEAPSLVGSFDFGLLDGRGSPPRLRQRRRRSRG